MPQVPTVIEKWAGNIHQVSLGGGRRKGLLVGGESALPFLHLDGQVPNRPLVAAEVLDKAPLDWPAPLQEAWGKAVEKPATWSRKAQELGADLIALYLKSAHPEEENTGAAEAERTVAEVLAATDLPLIVLGPYVADKDNEVLTAAAKAGRGERLALGFAEEKNYRAIGRACLENDHVVIAKTPIEINLAKQLNILLCDMGLPPDAILMDPTTGALGYGLEYTYSVMERLRLAGLRGDSMTAMPMFCAVGEEAWRQKETRSSESTPEAWGDYRRRALLWEELTASSLLLAGANIVVLRHPQNIESIKAAIGKWMAGP